jgi:kynurenine formamidase
VTGGRVVDLSFPIRPHFRWTVAREVRAAHARGDLFESSVLTIACHAYTHVDAPRHFLPGDRSITDMPLDQWIGAAAVIDLTHLGANAEVTAGDLEQRAAHLRAGDIALLRTDWPRRASVEDERFWREAPFTGRGACEWLVARGVKAVGYDYPPDRLRGSAARPGGSGRIPRPRGGHRRLTAGPRRRVIAPDVLAMPRREPAPS